MIEVFKTNIEKATQAAEVARTIKAVLKGSTVTCDLEDCDRVLRVVASKIDAARIIVAVEGAGFLCALLPD